MTLQLESERLVQMSPAEKLVWHLVTQTNNLSWMNSQLQVIKTTVLVILTHYAQIISRWCKKKN